MDTRGKRKASDSGSGRDETTSVPPASKRLRGTPARLSRAGSAAAASPSPSNTSPGGPSRKKSRKSKSAEQSLEQAASPSPRRASRRSSIVEEPVEPPATHTSTGELSPVSRSQRAERRGAIREAIEQRVQRTVSRSTPPPPAPTSLVEDAEVLPDAAPDFGFSASDEDDEEDVEADLAGAPEEAAAQLRQLIGLAAAAQVEPPQPQHRRPDQGRPSFADFLRFAGGGGGGRMAHGHIQSLLEGMKALDDEDRVLMCATEMCEYLAMANEETMASFPTDPTVATLVDLLTLEHNPDIMLLATRALSHLMEVVPQACGSVAGHGAIPHFVSKLLTMEYIDVAEVAIQALEKVSHEQPGTVLKAGGLTAVLQNLDFFSVNLQRSAVGVAANICRQVNDEAFASIRDSVPTLTNLLNYKDKKIVDTTCLCFARLAEGLQHNQAAIQELAQFGLLDNLLSLINPLEARQEISPGTHTLIVHTLATLVRASTILTLQMLTGGIAPCIQRMLGGGNDPHNTSTASASSLMGSSPIQASPASQMQRSSDQLYEILSLANELLPAFELAYQSDAFGTVNSPQPIGSPFGRGGLQGGAGRRKKQAEKEETNNAARAQLYKDHPELMAALGDCLLPPLLSVFSSTVLPRLKYKCLSVITRILSSSTSEMLTVLLLNIPASAFVASLLSSNDLETSAIALVMAQILINALPEIFEKYFRREGVFHEINRLADRPADAPMTEAETARAAAAQARRASYGGEEDGDGSEERQPETPSAVNRRRETRVWVTRTAQEFRQKHGGGAAAAAAPGSEELTKLRTLSQQIGNLPKNMPGEADSSTLLQLRSTLITEGEGISTFEFVGSGLVEALLAYLTISDVVPATVEPACQAVDSATQSLTPLGRARVRLFCAVFLDFDVTEWVGKVSSSGQLAAVRYLVNVLVEALNKIENYPVMLCSPAGATQGLRILTQAFKLKLERDPNERILDDHSGAAVLIEPLATVSSIEDFLLSKLRPEQVAEIEKLLSDEQLPPTPSTGRRGSRAGLGAADDGLELFDDEQDGEEEDDGSGETRFRGRRQQSDSQAEPVQDFKLGEDAAGVAPMDATSTATATSGGEGAGPSRGRGAPAAAGSAPPQPGRGRGTPTGTAAAAATNDLENRLGKRGPERKHIFGLFLDGVRLDYSYNIFQAVQQLQAHRQQTGAAPTPMATDDGEETVMEINETVRTMWQEVYTLRYRVLTPAERRQIDREARPRDVHMADATENTTAMIDSLTTNQAHVQRLLHGSSSLINTLTSTMPCTLARSDPTFNLLRLLRALHALVSHGHLVCNTAFLPSTCPAEMFISQKVTAKLLRQLQDPLTLCSAALPEWCSQLIAAAPFLISFNARRQHFFSTSFGVARALMRLQDNTQLDGRLAGGRQAEGVRVGRIQRQKVRIARTRILESARKVMSMYGAHKAVLEVEYFDEAGTGLGPTLEFYTTVSRELHAKELNLWRSSEVAAPVAESQLKEAAPAPSDAGAYVVAPSGLFPLSILGLDDAAVQARASMMRFVGRFMGKALLDSRLIDLPFSSAVYKYLRGESLNVNDIADVDPVMFQSLQKLMALSNAKRALDAEHLSEADRQKREALLMMDGAPIDALCLDFTLPGTNVELIPKGTSVNVTLANLEQYVAAIVEATVGAGVTPMLNALASGLGEVFPNLESKLVPFTAAELDSLLLGTEEPWSLAELAEHTKADHGYEQTSETVLNLFEIMHSFDREQRREFLKFVTGSPRLPFGGWAALTPKLTIVQKTDVGRHADEVMPSVMTCQNFLKIPRYSSLAVLREKLLRAISDGQGSFLLS